MMRHHEWTDRLSELLDGELPPAEHAAVQRHVDGCAECARVLSELREVVALARSLEERPPSRDLWGGIEARIQTAPLGPRVRPGSIPARRRRFAFSLPSLIAASLALVSVSGGTVWLILSRGAGPAPEAAATLPAAGAVLVADVPEEFGETTRAIAELERALAASRGRLDPETLRVIDENLALIDQAIEEVRQALTQDPASMYLNLYMADTMRRKLQLLQEMESLAARAL